MGRRSLGILLSFFALLPGCVAYHSTDMNRVAVHFDSCTSLEGAYWDCRDVYSNCSPESAHMSLWELLTFSPEDDSSIMTSSKSVVISNCTSGGFDIALVTPLEMLKQAHVTGRFEDGYFFIDRKMSGGSFLFVFNSISDRSIGIGRNLDGGIIAIGNQDELSTCLGIVAGSFFIPLNATFPDAPQPAVAKPDQSTASARD